MVSREWAPRWYRDTNLHQTVRQGARYDLRRYRKPARRLRSSDRNPNIGVRDVLDEAEIFGLAHHITIPPKTRSNNYTRSLHYRF